MTDEEKKPKHPWRENFEGLALAIVMALTLKYFVLEAYKIPTGSMQPTLMGVDQPELQIFDRILVDKLAYLWREPERWEVVVFKYPLDQSKNYIKRLIGLPHETVRIQNGNVYVRNDLLRDGPKGASAFQIARKPKSIQDTLWKEVYHNLPDEEEIVPQSEFWKEESGAWDFVGSSVLCTKPGTLAYRKPIVDFYADGYPRAIRALIAKGQREPYHNVVGDVRVSCTTLANPKTSTLSITIDSGAHRYRVRVAGPDGEGKAEIFVDGKSFASVPFRLKVTQPIHLRFAHWDEQLELEADGETVLRVELPAFFDERSGASLHPVSLDVEGGGIKLSDLRIDRDIHYISHSDQAEWKIPEGRFFFLGDNTQNSYDGRLWKAEICRLRVPGKDGKTREIFGDGGLGEQNPRLLGLDGLESLYLFTDQYGEAYRFEESEVIDRNRMDYPFVPRSFLIGKAILVFWPMPPFSPVPRWKVIF